MSNHNPPSHFSWFFRLLRLMRHQRLVPVARLKAVAAVSLVFAAIATAGAIAATGSTAATGTAPGNSPHVAQTSEGFDLEATYMRTCFACHSTGLGGAPKVGPGNKADWDARIADKGMDGMLQSVINGLNTMTPKGLCFECSDEDLRALMEYMVESSSE